MSHNNQASLFVACAANLLRMRILAVALLVVMIGFGGFAHGQQPTKTVESLFTIQAINVHGRGDDVLVKIDLNRPLIALPKTFVIGGPHKVVLDLPSTKNGLGRSSQSVNQGALRRIHIAQSAGRSRLVFDLLKATDHTVKLEGNTVVLVLTGRKHGEGESVMAPPPMPNKSLASSKNSMPNLPQSIKDINFRRGVDGEGRILIDLSDSRAAVDVRREGDRLIADFQNMHLPKTLRRTLDVTDFSTPVSRISTVPHGGGARMTILPINAGWEYTAYQTNRQYVIEFRQVKEDPNKLVSGSGLSYEGPKVSVNFQNGDIRGLLRLMAEEIGFNAVISDSVEGNVTLALRNVPADQVLDLLFQQKSLDMRKNGNVILIAPREELTTNERRALEEKNQLEGVEALFVETFQVNYQKASEVANMLNGGGSSGTGSIGGATGGQSQNNNNTQGSTVGGVGTSRILSSRGSVTADNRSNLLFIKDTAKNLKIIRELINKTDVKPRQVMIEARLVEASDSFGKVLGVRLGTNTTAGRHNLFGGNLNHTNFDTGQATDPAVIGDTLNVNLPGVPTSGAAGSFALSLFNKAKSRFLNLELTTLESDGRGKVLSSPRVMTTNLQEALIEQGVNIPYQQTSTSGGSAVSTTSFEKANLSLKVTPLITPNGKIQLDIEIFKDSVSSTVQTSAGVAIDTRHIKTQAMIENGGTIAIGGIFTESVTNYVNKIPILGDLPIVGVLFRNNQTQREKVELVVFISPRIVNEASSLRY